VGRRLQAFSRPLLGLHGTSQGAAFQISDEYSARVLSLENFLLWLAKISSQARSLKNQQHPVRN
jgi:hypothetical protein